MLTTEQRNPCTMHIDQMDTLSMMQAIDAENHKAVQAVSNVLPEIARAVDAIAAAFEQGGRLIYIGGRYLRPAGGIGRIGMPSHLWGSRHYGGGADRRGRQGPPRLSGRSGGPGRSGNPGSGRDRDSAKRTCWWEFPPQEAPPMWWTL